VRPVYWKPRYATRHMRERAMAKQQLARERALKREPHEPLLKRLARRLRGR
jgi:hypothetical protein